MLVRDLWHEFKKIQSYKAFLGNVAGKIQKFLSWKIFSEKTRGRTRF